MSDAPPAEGDSKEPAKPKAPMGPLLIALVNTLAVAGALGMAVYTKMLYHRPQITEEGERERLEKEKNKPTEKTEPGTVDFKPFTLNIAPSKMTTAQGTPRMHYATIAFTLEIRDASKAGSIEAIRTPLMDKLLQLLGKKEYAEVTTVQGRYVFRTQIQESANDLLNENLVSAVYFTQFIVQ